MCLTAGVPLQTEGFSRLAEGKSTAEMARHQMQQQLSDTKQKCVLARHHIPYQTAFCKSFMMCRLKLASAAQAEAETKLASRSSDLTQATAEHEAVAHQLEVMSSR